MSKRINGAAVAAAIKTNFAASPSVGTHHASHVKAHRLRRSTFKAPIETIIALRGLALHNGCAMNDRLLVAIDHLLTAAEKPTVIPVQQDLWDRIRGQGERQGRDRQPGLTQNVAGLARLACSAPCPASPT
jgi:hypothetical protein